MSSDEKKKPKGRKPWRNRVKLRHNIKVHAREEWSAAQRAAEVKKREVKRARRRPGGRPLKYRRLELLRESQISAARAERMRSLNAKRAAAKQE